MIFLTQHLGLSIFDADGLKQPSILECTNPNVGLKNVQLKVEVELTLNSIFNPTFGFVHI